MNKVMIIRCQWSEKKIKKWVDQSVNVGITSGTKKMSHHI